MLADYNIEDIRKLDLSGDAGKAVFFLPDQPNSPEGYMAENWVLTKSILATILLV